MDKLQYAYSWIKTSQFETLQNQKTVTQKIDYWISLISKIGWCDIKEPKIPDVYPTQCGYPFKTGDFEWYNSWEILWSDCMFSSSWNNWIVQNWIGKWNSKWLRNITSNINNDFSYSISASKPFKLSFDYKSFLSNGWQSWYFSINWYNYITKNTSDSSYVTYTTQMLPAWNYVFKFWTNTRLAESILRVDNIKVSCIWWGWTCWRSDITFENWNSNPWDIFTFAWIVNTPWLQTTDATQWTYAITTPLFPSWRKSNSLVKHFSFITQKKILFD